MSFEVTILGNGAAIPTVSKHPTAHVLNVREQFYLIDCGEGTQMQLLRCGIHPLRIRAVFISHLHGDHLYGLFPLLSTLSLQGRRTPLMVFGPPALEAILESHARHFELVLDFELQFVPVDTTANALVYENKVMEVFSIPLRHRVASCGYLFREKRPPLNVRKEMIELYGLGTAQIVAAKRGEDVMLDSAETIPNDRLTYLPYEPRSYAYCSDTQYSAKVAGIVSGVNLLYHEATFMDADKALARQTGHSTALDAGRVAAKAGVGRLLIGHISNRYKESDIVLAQTRTVFADSFLAEEMKTYSL